MKKILYIFSIALLLVSCSDFLDEDNKGGITSDDVYGTADGFEGLVAVGYNSLRTIYGREPYLWNSGTDMYMLSRTARQQEIQTYDNLDYSNVQVRDFYTDVYRGIQIINTGIYYANRGPSGMDAGLVATRTAELRFIRAFYHFLLVEQFGGIAINDRMTEEYRTDLVRSSLEASYQFIIDEMEDLYGSLPAVAAQTGRVDQRVVNHYLAKVYLTRGYDLNNQADFTSALNYANRIIDSESITIPFDELWHPSNQNNEEVIWAVQYSTASMPNTQSDGNIQQALFGPYLGGQAEKHKYTASLYPVTWHMHDRFDIDDARYEATFMLGMYDPYFTYWDDSDKSNMAYRYYYPRLEGRVFDKTDAEAMQLENPSLWGDTISVNAVTGEIQLGFIVENEQGSNTLDLITTIWPFPASPASWIDVVTNHAPVKKFDDPFNLFWNFRASSRDVVIARVAETYFIAAEAYLALSQEGEAARLINAVINRPGNFDGLREITAGEMDLDRLLIESSKEFLGEYLRWPELRRTGRLIDFCVTYNPDIDDASFFLGPDGRNKIYRPIPQTAIDGNDQMTQNPGYITGETE